jgi:DNA-binding Xre family transcriptional regulator
MSINWRLKTYLARNHQIYSVTDFQKRIVKRSGVTISVSNLCKYVNRDPKRLDLKTVELFCTALQCELKDFLSVTPLKKVDPRQQKKLSVQTTPRSKIGVKDFPEPENYDQ